jgi:zinc protease
MSRLAQRVGIVALLAAAAVVTVAAQDRPDRTRPPALGPVAGLRLPQIHQRTLANGVRVFVVESHEVPLVQFNLLVMAGAGDDPADQFGVASLTAAMLDQGAAGRTSLAIADEIEFLGATLSASSSFDATAVRLNVPVARLDAGLSLLADVVLRPTFADADLERVRKDRLTSMLQAQDDPESIAPRAFQRVVFGATHRYGTPAFGSEASLARLTADNLRSFHRQWYQPAHARIVVVGDVAADAAVARLDNAFRGWAPAPAVSRRAVPAAPQLGPSGRFIVDHPDAAQSQIRLGHVGVSRSTRDFFALEVLNTVLGGSFTSRLNQNLREEHQYAYGAASRFDMRLSAGPFLAAAGVQTDKTAEALQEFLKELNGITAPVPTDELARARNFLALGFPADFETTLDLAIRLEELLVYGLPDEYYAQYVGNIQAVTAADVQAAARQHILPSRLAIVVVGDRRTIEAPIRALGLAPVQVLTVEQALGL